MRIQIVSDLHLEFDRGNYDFIESLDSSGIDVFILAGDICMVHNMEDAMSVISEKYKDSVVLWVHGNHEYYNSSPHMVKMVSTEVTRKYSNIKWLDNSWVEIKGRRFLGTTLWFREDPLGRNFETFMNDFNLIRGFREWVYDQNRRSTGFLQQEMKPGDVVISHHLPSRKSIHPRYQGSELNRFFVCDMEEEILEKEPILWVHGHTHHPFDYNIGSTRIFCNPRGYRNERILNGDNAFKAKIIELP